MYRRSLVDQIGMLNEQLNQISDLDFYIRVCEIGDIKVIEEPLYLFRIHDGNTSKVTPEHNKKFEEQLKMVRKRHYSKHVVNCPPVLQQIEFMTNDPMSRFGWRTA